MLPSSRALLVVLLALLLLPVAKADDWFYRVQRGDTLFDIGAAYLRLPHDWPALQRLNRVDDPYRLQPGTALRIPVNWLAQGSARATVIHVRGRVFVRRAGEEREQPLQAGDQLEAGSVLRSEADSNASLRFVDGSRLLLSSDSELELKEMKHYGRSGMAATRLRVQHGEVESRVRPLRQPASRFRIETDSIQLGVRGTHFRLAAAAASAGGTEVVRGEVESGRVSLQRGRQQAELSAGEGLLSAAVGELGARRALLPAPVLDALAAELHALPLAFQWPAGEGASRWRAQVFARGKNEGKDRGKDHGVAGEDEEILLFDRLLAQPKLTELDLPDGRWRLRVRAIAADGLEGRDASHDFVLAARPAPPLPLAPLADSTVHGGQLRLRWALPLDGVRFRLQLAGRGEHSSPDAQDADPLLHELLLEGSEHTIRLPAGAYRWRLASLRADGHQGPFGPWQDFSLAAVPAAPQISESRDEQGSIELRWLQGVAGLDHRLQLARDPAFEQLLIDQRVAGSRFELPALAAGSYWLRLQVLGEQGEAGAFGVAQQLQIDSSRPLWPALLLLLPLLL